MLLMLHMFLLSNLNVCRLCIRNYWSNYRRMSENLPNGSICCLIVHLARITVLIDIVCSQNAEFTDVQNNWTTLLWPTIITTIIYVSKYLLSLILNMFIDIYIGQVIVFYLYMLQ